jgi:hypothetical protein
LNRTGPFSLRRMLGAAAAVGVLLLLIGLQTTVGRSLLEFAGLTHPDERFLELYFTDPAGLTTEVFPGQVVPVSFTVTAHGSTMPVPWRMETVAGDRTTPVASGTLTVPAGEARTVSVDATIACSGVSPSDPRTQVRVSAGAPAQQILFWVACKETVP